MVTKCHIGNEYTVGTNGKHQLNLAVRDDPNIVNKIHRLNNHDIKDIINQNGNLCIGVKRVVNKVLDIKIGIQNEK